MTQQEYQKLYLSARKSMGKLTLEARRELLSAYKQAGNLVTKDVILSGLIDQSLQAGADLVSQTLEDITPNMISRTYANFLSVDEEFIMDAVQQAGVGQITRSGIKNIGFTVNQELLRISATRLYSDGYTFSDRVWGLFDSAGKPIGVNGDYQYRIKNIILTGQAQGRDAVKIADDIQVYIAKGRDAVFTPGRYGKLIPGTAEYKARISRSVDWRALRIVRSELGASLKDAGLLEGDLNPAATGMFDWVKTPGNPIDPDGSKNASGLRCIDLQRNSPYRRADAPGQQHPNCFAEGTEVYTDKGWIDFRDIDLSEKFLSVNPETMEYEWVKAIEKQDFYLKGTAYEIKGKWFNLKTSGNHNNFVRHPKFDNYEFLTTQELLKTHGQRKIPRFFTEWKGKNLKTVKLGDHNIATSVFCEFMGYYLSEGHVTKRKNKDVYFGGISQLKKNNIQKIQDLLNKMPFYFGRCKKGWYFYDKSVCLDLFKYGKSWEKYVPEIIKSLGKKNIKAFLDAYILGDGNISKERVSSSGINNKARASISTSSKRMADELGELIVKAGGSPTYHWQEAKNVTHKNGTYLTKHPAIIVSWNKSQFACLGRNTVKIKEVDYEGRMLDVTLEKNHVLWVRYQGQTCFSGNCSCYLRPVLMKQPDFVDDLKNWTPGRGPQYLDQWYYGKYLQS